MGVPGDAAVVEFAQQAPAWLVDVARACSHGARFAPVAVLAIYVCIRLRSTYPFLLVALATIATDRLTAILKASFGRLRPPLALDDVIARTTIPSDASMPSGHASTMFAIVTMLALIWRPGRAVTSLLLAGAGAVAASRVILGVHYPSDVVAGAALGAAVSYLLYRLLGVGRAKQVREASEVDVAAGQDHPNAAPSGG